MKYGTKFDADEYSVEITLVPNKDLDVTEQHEICVRLAWLTDQATKQAQTQLGTPSKTRKE